MALIFTGRSTPPSVAAGGRSTLGLPAEVDLSVDTAEDLAADPQQALQVAPGVVWAGASAAKTLET